MADKKQLQYQFGQQSEDVIDFMYKQIRQSMRESTVTCGCGNRQPLRYMFRCYYCGVFFCHKCAGEHFGKTREEYYAGKKSKD